MYWLVNSFLRVVQLRTLDKLVQSTNLTALDSEENVISLMQYFSGYLVCVGFGLMFLVILPLICCCISCAQSSDTPRQPQAPRCGICIYTTITITGSVVVLFLCSQFFFQNMLLRRETSAGNGIKSETDRGLKILDDYTQQVFLQPYTILDMSKCNATSAISQLSDAYRNATSHTLGNTKGAFHLINAALTEINHYLTRVGHTVGTIRNNTLEFNELLPSVKQEVKNLMLKGNQAVHLGFLMKVNYSTTVPSLAVINLTDFKSAISNMFMNDEYNNIQGRLGNSTEIVISGFIRDNKLLQQKINQMAYDFQIVNNALQIIMDALSRWSFYIEQYACMLSQINFGSVIIMASVLLLALFGVLLGLSGWKGKSKQPAYILMKYTTNFVFVISMFPMVTTTVMFLTGGVAKTEVCRYLTYQPEVRHAVPVLDNFLCQHMKKVFKLPISFSLVSTIRQCKRNASLVDAMGFTGMNRSLGLNTAGLRKDLLNEHNIVLPNKEKINVSILADVLFTLKLAYERLETEKIIYNLNQSTVNLDWAKTANEIKALPNLDKENKSSVSGRLLDLNRIVRKIVKLKAVLSATLNQIENKASQILNMNLPSMVSSGQDDVFSTKERLVADRTDIVSKFVDRYSESLENIINRSKAPCGPIFSAGHLMVQAHCQHFLNPYNSSWFFSGAVHVVLVLVFIYVQKLSEMYKSIRSLLRAVFFRRSRVLPEDCATTQQITHSVDTGTLALLEV